MVQKCFLELTKCCTRQTTPKRPSENADLFVVVLWFGFLSFFGKALEYLPCGMARGGRRGAGLTTNSCAINHRTCFSPVKLCTIDLKDIRGPGYR